MAIAKSLPIAAMLLFVSGGLSAAEPTKPSIAAPIGKDTLIFTAPPRETPEAGARIYQPVADYLSKVIGKPIVYQHPRSWGLYRTEMLMGRYDVVFDGPQFNGYRVEKLGHNMIAKLPEVRDMYIIVRKDEKLTAVSELAGRTVCTQVPPNLDGLVALMPFENPSQYPVIVPVKGREAIYQGVITGRCTGGVLPSPDLRTFDKDGVATRIVFKSQPVLDQAMSAGPRISPADQAKMAAAMVAPQAEEPTEKLRTRFRGGDRFYPATNAEYAAMAPLLKNEWGFADGKLATR